VSQTIPGQALREADFEPVAEGLRRFITDLLFRPLAQIWREEVGRRLEYQNSADSDRQSLVRALRGGRLQFSIDERGRGTFSGESNAALGRALRALGATFDARERVYRIDPAMVPTQVLAAGAAHAAACERAHQRMERFLLGAQSQLDRAVENLNPEALQAGTSIRRVAAGFDDAVRRVGIPFEKPDAVARAALSAAYTKNMKLWIRKWAAGDIVRLRHEVEANARSGARASTLASRISARYDVGISKARFLARQESGLFMAQYHKEQFTAAGVPRYVWRTSKDEDVRKGHAELEGRIFTWAEGAPAKYMSCGRNCNPHEDFQCRCVARPLVDTAYNARFKIGDTYVRQSA
jgi:SPP1 gp7 family putative phage head morphogenesis protein